MAFSICKVGDYVLQTYQTQRILKRATTIKFTTISPILYIHCCDLVLFKSHHLICYIKIKSIH